MDLDVWARSIVEHVEHHMETERDVLTQYGELANDTSDERVRYLVHLILRGPPPSTALRDGQCGPRPRTGR